MVKHSKIHPTEIEMVQSIVNEAERNKATYENNNNNNMRTSY